jgi:uncharacterized membrane protein required for colicin V production
MVAEESLRIRNAAALCKQSPPGFPLHTVLNFLANPVDTMCHRVRRRGACVDHCGWLFDGCIIGFLILQTFLGWRRGLLWQVAGVASIGFGVAIGMALSPAIGARLVDNVTSDLFRARMVGFLFVVALVGFLLRMLAAWAEVRTETGLKREERDSRRAQDRILGGIFGALKGSVLALIIVAACVAIYPESALWNRSTLARPLAVAGSRLLPEGAVDEVGQWASKSAISLKRGLDIH